MRRRRGEAGLTTLEWLLVVAAVAGLAAVAVVLVQRVVGETAEQVASNDARQTAADLAVTELQRRWRTVATAPDRSAPRLAPCSGQALRCSAAGTGLGRKPGGVPRGTPTPR